MIRGDRAMRHLSVYEFCRERIAGLPHGQEKSSLTPNFDSGQDFGPLITELAARGGMIVVVIGSFCSWEENHDRKG